MPRNRHRPAATSIRIHIPEYPIPKEDITTIDGIPVTKPARTILDLASEEPEDVIARCLDDALRRRLVSLPFLDRWLDDPIRKRHHGWRMLRRLVDERAIIGVTDSELESRVLALLRDASLPLPMLQYEVFDNGRFLARLDFAYPELRVAIEVDGFRHHDLRSGFDKERARGNDVESAGWRVLRVTAAHLENDPEGVVAWIRRCFDTSARPIPDRRATDGAALRPQTSRPSQGEPG